MTQLPCLLLQQGWFTPQTVCEVTERSHEPRQLKALLVFQYRLRQEAILADASIAQQRLQQRLQIHQPLPSHQHAQPRGDSPLCAAVSGGLGKKN